MCVFNECRAVRRITAHVHVNERENAQNVELIIRLADSRIKCVNKSQKLPHLARPGNRNRDMFIS